MSLEQALNENTAMMAQLVALLKEQTPVTLAVKDTAPSDNASTVAKVKQEEKKAPAPATVESAPETAAAGQPDYDTTAQAVIQLSKTKGRGVAAGILTLINPNAKTLKDIKPEQYAEVIAKAEEAMQEGAE